MELGNQLPIGQNFGVQNVAQCVGEYIMVRISMTQPPKKNKLPKNISDKTGHELMELVFGKRAMKAIDAKVSELSENKPKSNIKKWQPISFD